MDETNIRRHRFLNAWDGRTHHEESKLQNHFDHYSHFSSNLEFWIFQDVAISMLIVLALPFVAPLACFVAYLVGVVKNWRYFAA